MTEKEKKHVFSSNLLTITSILITIIIPIKFAYFDEIMSSALQNLLSYCSFLLFLTLILSLINTFIMTHLMKSDKESMNTAIKVLDSLSGTAFIISITLLFIIIIFL